MCGRIRANEKFSGAGRAAHICKKCSTVSKEKQKEEIVLNRIDRAMSYMNLSRDNRRMLEEYSRSPNERIREAALVGLSEFRVEPALREDAGLPEEFDEDEVDFPTPLSAPPDSYGNTGPCIPEGAGQPAGLEDATPHNNPPDALFQQLEFHRHGFALVPDPADRNPGVALLIEGDQEVPERRFCSCSVSRKRACKHILKLASLCEVFRKKHGDRTPAEAFRTSPWRRLAEFMAEGCRETADSVRFQFVEEAYGRILRAADSGGQEILRYSSQSDDSTRLVERCARLKADNSVPGRSDMLDKLSRLTRSPEEEYLEQKGFKTVRQVLEESFWYRFAYHGFREFGEGPIFFYPGIEEASGAFTATCRTSGDVSLFRLIIPRQKVKKFLSEFREWVKNQNDLAIHPAPIQSILRLRAGGTHSLEVEPMVRIPQENGESRVFSRESLERFRYGDLIYVPELKTLAELAPSGELQGIIESPGKLLLKKSQVPSFLQELGENLRNGTHIVDASIQDLRIHTRFDKIEINPQAIDRDWCWLSLRYGFGGSSISLADILRARRKGERFISIADGWVDCQSFNPDGVPALPEQGGERGGPPDRIRLSRMDLLRLQAASSCSLEVAGKGEAADRFKRLLDLKPAKPLEELRGLTSSLRPYQELGTEWLLFLFENGLGGLLCDDMGLGKTHQVMAFMLSLREHEGVKDPFLVVCPTTVLSHWEQKLSFHAPGLKAAIFYGAQRDLRQAINGKDVLVTSYGILRNDLEQLRQVPFALAVFDEIQNIKNAQTLAYEAAREIKAGMKLGLTGTPIENRLGELKALLDLTVSGYLGSDEKFQSQYVHPIEGNAAGEKREALSRLISPFTLRRLKKTVLKELPGKIEDIRTCTLSDDQVRLYRDAISSRARGLVAKLSQEKEPIPYMHIFALLTLLKQICDHPALVEGAENDFEKYQSGKWELFKELITEALDSGQKIVVYSQFLGMIRMIGLFLEGLGVGFASLTGSSRKRGEIVSRFNEDPDCRVYVGSLKAGGTGIDLVAGSVVIHYDRWWNAAKEDQATDRVHRIGQQRGVQVFKLVTQGTLEEKISAIIEKKRNLMESIVREDDPDLLKAFSREDLLEMLSFPG